MRAVQSIGKPLLAGTLIFSFGFPALAAERPHAYTLSTTIAMPWPTPMHIVHSA